MLCDPSKQPRLRRQWTQDQFEDSLGGDWNQMLSKRLERMIGYTLPFWFGSSFVKNQRVAMYEKKGIEVSASALLDVELDEWD
ncbi:unnamed protein product [Arabis nemorensis]|uniref:Uncharacterized protein n=1 Tax=Arabis nemorensis TaxID=586526 RepID=A0A565AZ52_9BRAS|nr:unnamed protein product [Arabis nemorensis]